MPTKNQQTLVKKFITPFERFFSMQASAGIILLISGLAALFLANSPWSKFYTTIIHYPFSIHLGGFSLSYSLQHWVNDALMVIFFFVVGLEIKRELHQGELASPKKAALPIFAAIGGMLVPALIYLIFNSTEETTRIGWGIPMATDIAFAVGILSLASKRVPLSLKVFLLALAIVDDLGAVLVIAFFYSQEILPRFLGFAGFTIFLIYFAKKTGIKHYLFYISTGVCLWFFILKSGVHPTIAGVILGLLSPSQKTAHPEKTLAKIRNLTESDISYKNSQKVIHLSQSLHSTTYHLIELLHPYVNWFIMPVFAFFNAGVAFKSGFSTLELLHHPVSLGILLGLVIGKPLGILLFSCLAVHFKLAVWPSDFSWARLTGVSFLAGIGFTMALFISHLSFGSLPEISVYSKISILIASLIAMVMGLLILLLFAKNVDTNKGEKKLH